jgi:hypothetical protein
MVYNLRVMLASIWRQGFRSSYRLAYWRFLLLAIRTWYKQPAKLWLGIMVLLAANHFVKYSKEVSTELSQHCDDLERDRELAALLPMLAEPAMLKSHA